MSWSSQGLPWLQVNLRHKKPALSRQRADPNFRHLTQGRSRACHEAPCPFRPVYLRLDHRRDHFSLLPGAHSTPSCLHLRRSSLHRPARHRSQAMEPQAPYALGHGLLRYPRFALRPAATSYQVHFRHCSCWLSVLMLGKSALKHGKRQSLASAEKWINGGQ